MTQTSSFFKPSVSIIKRQIESLIDKEFLARDDQDKYVEHDDDVINRNTLKYVA